jgi:hypothetical protein
VQRLPVLPFLEGAQERADPPMGAIMFYRLLAGAFVIGIAAVAMTSAGAQPFTEAAAANAIRDAYAAAARIRSYHRWTGLTPVPASYCPTMRQGEAVLARLARLSSRAILYRLHGLALRMQAAGNALSDALDEEEEVNQQAGIPYDYPCPVPPGPYPRRAVVLRIIDPKAPSCRRQADALRLSFDARRALMQRCLRIPGT